MSTGTGRESDKFMLRLPDGMRDRIKIAADENSRSMNAEIVAVLEREYPAPQDTLYLTIDHVRRRLDEYEATDDPTERLFLQTVIESLVSGRPMPTSMQDIVERAKRRETGRSAKPPENDPTDA